MKKTIIVAFLAVVIFFCLMEAAAQMSATEYVRVEDAPKDKPSEQKKKVELLPELVPICACESVGRKNGIPTHFNPDGTVKRGKINSNDIGMCQINLTYHESSALSMGLNLFERDDNIRYANYLYRQQGNKPWSWSRSCWE